jgi:hypothetical protein
MTTAPPWRIRCPSPRAHRKASSSGCSAECMEIVSYMSLLSATASCGRRWFLLSGCCFGIGLRNAGRQSWWSSSTRTMGLEAEEHAIEPQPTCHRDMCFVVHNDAFFGSQSIDAMVLQRFFGAWCPSPPVMTMSTKWLVDDGRR